MNVLAFPSTLLHFILTPPPSLRDRSPIFNILFRPSSVHQEWCGPTSAILSYVNQLWIDLEDAHKKVHLSSLAIEDSSTQLIKKIQSICDPDVKVANQGCKPLFLLFRNGMCVGTVDGVNSPAISMYVKLHTPGSQSKSKGKETLSN